MLLPLFNIATINHRPMWEKGEIIFTYFFGYYTAGNRGNVRTLPEYDRVSNPQDFTAPAQRNGGAFTWGIRIFYPNPIILKILLPFRKSVPAAP